MMYRKKILIQIKKITFLFVVFCFYQYNMVENSIEEHYITELQFVIQSPCSIVVKRKPRTAGYNSQDG